MEIKNENSTDDSLESYPFILKKKLHLAKDRVCFYLDTNLIKADTFQTSKVLTFTLLSGDSMVTLKDIFEEKKTHHIIK